MVQNSLKILVICALLAATPAWAASLTPGLVNELRHGGYVLLMRHASSPTALPSPQTADPENKALERQLDDNGRATATAMGRAIKVLHIPVGTILSSPTYRARQTVRLAGLGEAKTFSQLGDGGHSMEKDAVSAQANWLREKVSEAPASGTNTLIVTHMPNIATAFGDAAKGLGDGETLLFRPAGREKASLVARIPISEWPALAR